MKIVASRKALQQAVQAVASVSPARSPKPILQSLKLIAGDVSTLMATDLEVGIRYRVPGIEVVKPGSAILPTAKIQQILATSYNESLSIEVIDDTLHVQGERSSYKLPSEDPDLFPEVPDFPESENYYKVGSNDLAKAISRTIFATDIESTRYALGGVLLEAENETLSLIGTDGRRLAKQFVSLSEGSTIDGKPVVPVKCLKLLQRLASDNPHSVDIAFNGTSDVRFRTDNAVIYSRLVEGRFPRYQDVFPTTKDLSIPLNVGEFSRAISQAAITTSNESRGVDFDFAAGCLTLSANAADTGASSVEMPISHDGKTVLITFDPRYVTDALKTLGDDTEVEIDLIDGKHAAVLRADGYQYVIMPLTRDK